MLKDRVKNLRKSKSWTQVQLADAAGVSQQTIGKIETGKAAESRKLPSIAAALGVSVEELMQDEVKGPEAKSQAPPPVDRIWQKLGDLWIKLDRAGKKHVLRSAQNELARFNQRPSQPGGVQKISKKRRASPKSSISQIRAY